MIEGIGYSQSGTAEKLSSAGTKSAIEQKDQFLKLLTFQLKSQNPLKPYDNQEFAAQLAQFSQLEQLSDIRNLMEEQGQYNSQLSRNISNAALPGMLGKTAKAVTNHVQLDENKSVEMGYNLQYPMSDGIITILDQYGNTVNMLELSGNKLNSGEHKFNWDGTDFNGDPLPEGSYTFFADFEESDGNTVSAETFTSGIIEAVRFKADGTVLVVGGMEIPISEIKDVGL
jgi:flagellar basal-body rod modification protein FlgD